jgi:hypothetical protein
MQLLVPEVALAGEYHHHPVLIGGSDRLIITLASTWLHDRCNTDSGKRIGAVAKWEERIARRHCPLGPHASSCARNTRSVNPILLTRANANGAVITCQHDGIRTHRCTRHPRHRCIAQLCGSRLLCAHHLPL